MLLPDDQNNVEKLWLLNVVNTNFHGDTARAF